jgi:hypothetical protein
LDHCVFDLLLDLLCFFFGKARLALAVFGLVAASTSTFFFFDVLV